MTAYDVQKNVADVTARIRERSRPTRERYLDRVRVRAEQQQISGAFAATVVVEG